MEDVAVVRHESVSFVSLSDKAESGKSTELVENASGLQTSSNSRTATSTDIVVTQDADHKRQRKSQTRMWVEWILIGVVITAVWILTVGVPILFYHLPEGNVTQPSVVSGGISAFNFCNISNMNCTIVCREDFYLDEVVGYCRPHCGRWKAYPPTSQTVQDAFVIMSAAGAIIAVVIVITLAFFRHKKVFKFPSVFIIYQNITVVVFAIVVLVGYTAKEPLFCSSDDVTESLDNPTPFCTVIGIVSYFAVMQLALWALCLVVMMFLGVVFPIHMKHLSASGKIKYIHITMVLLGLILPCVPVAVTLGTGGFSPRDVVFPPIVCFGRNRGATVYSHSIVDSILLATGLSLLILVFYKFIKMFGFKLQRSKGAEVRILIVFCYYAILGFFVIAGFNVASRRLGLFSSALDAYFLCERGGIGNNCDRSGLDSFTNPALVTITYSLCGIYPAVNLVYVIHIADLKSLKQKCHCFK